MIISILSFVAIATKIPLGILAERVGRWRIIPTVAIGQTVSLLLYSFVPNVTWFYPIRIFHAFILAAFAPTALAIVQDLTPPSKRGTTIGKYLTSVGVATAFDPFLCTSLVNYVNYVQLFQIASVIPLLGSASLLLVRHESSHVPSRRKTNPNLSASLKAIISSRTI